MKWFRTLLEGSKSKDPWNDPVQLGFRYEAQWKEIAVGSFGSTNFYMDLTMGVYHLYFPSRDLWLEKAPDWMKSLYDEAFNGAINWCKKRKYEFSVGDNVYLEFA